MNKLYCLIATLLICGCTCNDLPRASRSELPCDVNRFDQVFNDVWSLACNELHGLMVVKDGKVIYEKYDTGHDADELHVLWSASKTFTATAIGFAQQDGLLSVDDCILDYLEEEAPENPSEWLRSITIEDLLVMSSGFDSSSGSTRGRTHKGAEFDWAIDALASPIIFEPGTMFRYNSMDSYLLSVIVSKVTGLKMDEYLEQKLFKPLGIDRYEWKKSPQGYPAGGWGLYLNLESMAKMGQFFLNKGTWNGKRLLDESWFDEAMSVQIKPWQGRMTAEEAEARYKYDEWQQGYGYQMWACTHGAYRLDGAWGQYVIIVPEKNLVVACQAHNPDGNRFIQSVWNNIYNVL